jgi:phosphoserine aminotransferase
MQERVAKAIAENMSDIFDGGAFVGVMNAPDLGAVASLPEIVPYVMLAERMGSMQAQLLKSNKIGSITVNLRGKDIADTKLTDVMKSAVLCGALRELTAQPITYVNAISVAEELGLKVLVNMSEKTEAGSGYMNSMAVELEIEGSLNMTRVIEGTVFGRNELRITKIDGYTIELPPGENMLLCNNYDKPGALLKVANRLAASNINIAHFSLGRKAEGKLAMVALVLDTPASEEVLEGLTKFADVTNVQQVHLDSWHYSLPASLLLNLTVSGRDSFSLLSQLKLREHVDPNFRVRSVGQQGIVYGSSKPLVRPRNPEFSSGPCKKRPGYNLANLRTDSLGRSHRSKLGKSRLKKAIEDTKRILGVPDDYLCGIVPASDTGAYEMAMWNLLGDRPVDNCYWESFGKGWKEDAVKHLQLKNSRDITADYGHLPNLSTTNPDHDILFTFNGTTSGVRVPNLDWISDTRQGLTLNDATSAAFAMDMEWSKCDVTTFSWQKVLGGEGAHGIMIMSPRAVERLETIKHNRPLPKIFRMLKKDKEGVMKVDRSIFQGDTINTPSMLCVEDYLDALAWSDSLGGLKGLMKRSTNNLQVMEKFVAQNDWISFLAADPSVRSSTSVCFTLKLTKDQVKKFVALLEVEGVAYDIGSYRDAPDGLRIWCGATVEKEDLEALLPWLKWAYETVQETK